MIKTSPYHVNLDHNNEMMIAIQSHSGEIENGRIEKFININKLSFILLKNKYLFINRSVHTSKIRDLCKENNIKIVEINEKNLHEGINKTAHGFFNIVTYNIKKFPYVILLETDCKLSIDWYSVIKKDILGRDFWIYGSDNPASSNLNKMLSINKNGLNLNGVAVYYRTQEFISLIYSVINTCLNTRRNYDTILSEYIRNIKKNNKLYNSPYICDLSPENQKNINYRSIKPLTRILHQKY